MTFKLTEDEGRDINLMNATNRAMHMLCDFLKAECGNSASENAEES